MTLGTAVYLLPLRHPTLIAKTTATVDLLSGGRLVLGVGVGGEFPPEFGAVGVPVAERGSRADEAIGVVRRLWSEDGVAHDGRHFHFGAVTMAPKPARIPPIWVGGRAPAAMRRAGRLGDGYISHMTDADRYRENLTAIAAAARDAGRRDVAFTPACFLFTFLEDRFEDAEKKAAALLGTIYRRDFSEVAKRYCLLGRPEDCLEQLAAFARAGARHFILVPLSGPGAFAERAAREILPELRRLLAASSGAAARHRSRGTQEHWARVRPAARPSRPACRYSARSPTVRCGSLQKFASPPTRPSSIVRPA